MDWSTVVKYFLDFIKWAWDNKFTMLFIITTIVFMIMYSCSNMKVNTLTSDLDASKAKVAQCEQNYELCTRNYDSIVNTNNDMHNSVLACQRELKIVKESFARAEEINKQFDEEIKKYKELASAVDSESDPVKQFELRKKIIEELFKGTKVPVILKSLNNK